MGAKTDSYQLGLSVTPNNNFTLVADGAGGMKLARGNPGATTEDILVFDNNSRLQTLGKPSAFRAHKNNVNQSIPTSSSTIVTFGSEAFDLGNDFSANAWTPPAGRPIMMAGAITFLSVNTLAIIVTIFKNGVEFARGGRLDLGGSPTSSPTLVVTGVDVPNGTDVYTLVAFHNGGGANVVDGTVANTYFSGVRL